jgi:hypothetical protein
MVRATIRNAVGSPLLSSPLLSSPISEDEAHVLRGFYGNGFRSRFYSNGSPKNRSLGRSFKR